MSANELLTDDELAAAFAEIESTGGAESIPDLDDGSGSDGDSAASMVAVVNTSEPEFEAQPFDAVEEFGSGGVAGVIEDEFAAPEAAVAPQAKPAGGSAPKWRFQFNIKGILTQVNDRAYDAADKLLNAVNRPFARLDTKSRKVVVLGSLVTIGLSILVIVLAPLLIRGKTPMEFLHEKSSSLKTSVLSSDADAS